MAQPKFNLGKSYAILIVTQYGPLVIPNVTAFHAKQEHKKLSSEPINDAPQFASVPHGWTGSIDFDRTGPEVDAFFAASESAFWLAGGTYENGTVFVYITENSGAQTRFRFDGAALEYDDAGTAKGVDKVTGKISFQASTRTLL